MSVIPDIIPHKVYQVYCAIPSGLPFFLADKKALKKIVHPKFLPPLRLRP